MGYRSYVPRNRDGTIDAETITILGIIAMAVAGVFLIVFVGIRSDIEKSKLPEIRHYITQLEDNVNVEIWRKDGRYLNDSLILVEKDRIRVLSIGNKLEIPFEGWEIVSHTMDPIYRVYQGFFDSSLTNKVQKYVVRLKMKKVN